VAYVDIDDFPRFRHEHGPQAAQRILRAVARRLVRVGGSGRAFYSDSPTFVLVFPRTSAKAAARRIEAVRRAIEDITVDVSIPTASRGAPRTGRAAATVERTLSVTVSAGVAEAPRTGAEPRPVLDAAEQALVRARQAGMNCVSR
jgi:GGDEF domain-containing protein